MMVERKLNLESREVWSAALCDNQLIITIAKNPVFLGKMKHIKIKYSLWEKMRWMKKSICFIADLKSKMQMFSQDSVKDQVWS